MLWNNHSHGRLKTYLHQYFAHDCLVQKSESIAFALAVRGVDALFIAYVCIGRYLLVRVCPVSPGRPCTSQLGLEINIPSKAVRGDRERESLVSALWVTSVTAFRHSSISATYCLFLWHLSQTSEGTSFSSRAARQECNCLMHAS